MPTPAVALKLRKFRRRFGIAAPSVVVRSHLPWSWFAAGAMVLLALAVTATWLFLQRSEVGSINGELEALRLKVRELDDERLVLRSMAGTEQNVVLMERSTQQQLLVQVKALEAENTALKEDMRLFERLIPLPGDEALVRIENFRLTKDGDNRYRYRLLLTFQPAKNVSDFRGHLQFLASCQAGDREYQIVFPDKNDFVADFLVETKHLWRKEGVLELSSCAKFLRVEARVFQGDTLKTKKMAQF